MTCNGAGGRRSPFGSPGLDFQEVTNTLHFSWHQRALPWFSPAENQTPSSPCLRICKRGEGPNASPGGRGREWADPEPSRTGVELHNTEINIYTLPPAKTKMLRNSMFFVFWFLSLEHHLGHIFQLFLRVMVQAAKRITGSSSLEVFKERLGGPRTGWEQTAPCLCIQRFGAGGL